MKRLFAALTVAAIVLSGCQSADDHVIARVGSHSLTSGELDELLASPFVKEALAKQAGSTEELPGSVPAVSPRSIIAIFVRTYLSDSVLRELGDSVTTVDRSTAKEQIASQGTVGSPAAEEVLVNYFAAIAAVRRAIGETSEPSAAQLSDYYEQNRAQFADVICFEGIITRTPEIRAEARTKLEAGSSFEDVMQELNAADTTGEGVAGPLTDQPCLDGSALPPQEDAVGAVLRSGALDALSEVDVPASTGETFPGIIRVTDRGALGLDNEWVRTTVASAVSQDLSDLRTTEFNRIQQAAAARLEAHVDPRYGAFDPAAETLVVPIAPVESAKARSKKPAAASDAPVAGG